MENQIKGRLLVVEDDPDLLDAIADVLRPQGLQVQTARNGFEALQFLRQCQSQPETRPHAVLTDIQMPKMTGLELFSTALQEKINLPFVFLTAYLDRERALQALRLGALDLIDKPFESQRLLGSVWRALEAGHLSLQREQIGLNLGPSWKKISDLDDQFLDLRRRGLELG